MIAITTNSSIKVTEHNRVVVGQVRAFFVCPNADVPFIHTRTVAFVAMMIALVPTVYGRAEELIVAVVPGSTTSMIPDFAGSQRMALIGYGNRERSMPASIAESVFSLEQQLVVLIESELSGWLPLPTLEEITSEHLHGGVVLTPRKSWMPALLLHWA